MILKESLSNCQKYLLEVLIPAISDEMNKNKNMFNSLQMDSIMIIDQCYVPINFKMKVQLETYSPY